METWNTSLQAISRSMVAPCGRAISVHGSSETASVRGSSGDDQVRFGFKFGFSWDLAASAVSVKEKKWLPPSVFKPRQRDHWLQNLTISCVAAPFEWA